MTESPDPSAMPAVEPGDRPPHGPVVAIVPAKDRADSVAATVRALAALDSVDRVLVVDDGSTDGTGDAAAAAGADVLRLPVNRGKGHAVLAGARHRPDAAIYLLIDADLASTAAAADLLLEPVLSGEADMTVGVLPSAEGKGGFGLIRTASARAIEKACGLRVEAPLSGQRAVRAELLREMGQAERFGLEVGMTIDLARAGARIVEVPVPMDHRHTGRSVAGFAHRGRQGLDIARALWPRLTRPVHRIGLTVVATILAMALAMALGSRAVPPSEPGGAPASKVLVYAFNPYGFDALRNEDTPHLAALMDRGSVGAMNVRGVARFSNATEGFLSMGGGARLADTPSASDFRSLDESLGPIDVATHLRALTGDRPQGEVATLGISAVNRANDNASAAGRPGLLGDLLAEHDLVASFVGTSDRPAFLDSEEQISRPAGLATMGGDGGTLGVVDGLEVSDPTAPFGIRIEPRAFADSVIGELDRADLVVVDPGDLDRAAGFRHRTGPAVGSEMRDAAIRRTDETLGMILESVSDDVLVIVVSLRSEGGSFLQPVVVAGPNVPVGTVESASTKREGLSAITDLTPTILTALGAETPKSMPGNPLRYRAGEADLDALQDLDRDTVVREATGGKHTEWYIRAHTVILGLSLLVLLPGSRYGRHGGKIRFLVLALASFPMTSFLVRLIPDVSAVRWAQAALAVALALLAGGYATTRRRHPLAPLGWVAGATVAVIVADSWIGTPMQMSSWLGSSMHNAGRFYGIPNTTFAVVASCSIIWACLHVHRSHRRSEAVFTAAAVLLIVLLSAGLPMLGADVGTLMALTPAFGLLLVALSGRRLRIRTIVGAGTAMVAVVGLAAALDLARPERSRTHLGRFAAKILDEGPSAITDSFMRKQSANIRIFENSIWTDLLPIVALFVIWVLVRDRRYATALPAGSALRHCFWGLIGCAALGFATNDSGPIILALFGAFTGTFVAIAAVDEEAPPVEIEAGAPEPIEAGR